MCMTARFSLALALVFGLPIHAKLSRVLFDPPGYPLAQEYSICDHPEILSNDEWLYCVEVNGW